MPNKKATSKKSGFSLSPITLSEPVKLTDGFTNLVEDATETAEKNQTDAAQIKTGAKAEDKETEKNKSIEPAAKNQSEGKKKSETKQSREANEDSADSTENNATESRMTEVELLRLLDADTLDEIYELTDVLRASSSSPARRVTSYVVWTSGDSCSSARS